jgi:hypothetical protein
MSIDLEEVVEVERACAFSPQAGRVPALGRCVRSVLHGSHKQLGWGKVGLLIINGTSYKQESFI